MSGVIYGGISPHPPIAIPAIGRDDLEQAARTRQALQTLAAELQQAGPDTLVLITPHGPVFRDAVAVWTIGTMEGSFANFGVAQPVYRIENDVPFAAAIVQAAAAAAVPVLPLDTAAAARYGIAPELDHGILVPLAYFQAAGLKARVVPVAMGFLPVDELYRFGKAVQQAAEKSGRNIAVIASGDLSHRLTREAPAGYHPGGKAFDARMAALLGAGDVMGVLSIEEAMRERAGECGFRPVVMLLGALDGLALRPEIFSYEGPFGVGYLVGALRPAGRDPDREFLPRLTKAAPEPPVERTGEDPLVSLARQTLETYVREGKVIEPPSPLPAAMAGKAGVFVSLKMDGQLRGCIGTFLPTRENIAAEIIQNAISAGTEDPRFYPVRPEELAKLVYSVDVLSAPEPIEDTASLDPVRYGVIVRRGRRSGLLLPNLEGVDTVEEQLAIARQKAGIGPQEDVELMRFEVVRHQ